jgi:hypothetical protein
VSDDEAPEPGVPLVVDRARHQLQRPERIVVADGPAVARDAREHELARDARQARARERAVLVVGVRGEQRVRARERAPVEEGQLAPEQLLGRAAEHDEPPR